MGSKPKKISASRVSKLLGLNPFENGSQVDLWLELMDEEYPGWLQENGYRYEKKDISNKPEVKIGLMFEKPMVFYLNDTGYNIDNLEKEFSDGVLSCHLDCQDVNESGVANFNIENKTTTSFSYYKNFGDEETDAIPDYYYAQVQVQMGLSGVETTIMPVLVFPSRQVDIIEKIENDSLYNVVKTMNKLGLLKFHVVHFNEKVFNTIKEKAESFWEKHIVGRTPPSTDNFDDYKRIITPVYGRITGDSTSDIILNNYFAKLEDLKECKEGVDILKNDIINFMTTNAKKGRSGKTQMLYSNGRVAATYNHENGYFSIRQNKVKE